MRKGKRFRKNNKPAMLLVSLIMVLTVAVGGTLAYLVTQTEPVANTFTVEQVPIIVEEDFNNGVKSNVKIKHMGDEETGRNAYVRAAVVANWVDSKGNIYHEMPEFRKDYIFGAGNGTSLKSGWEKLGEYWYYTKPLAPGESTSDLISSCRISETQNNQEIRDKGYNISIDVLAQSIQADGTHSKKTGSDGNPLTPIEDAWGEEAARLVGAIQ